MEEGITDKEISFTINSNRVGFKKDFYMLHTLTSPAQIVNGILYVPIYSIFNKTYREHYVDNITADALKLNVSKENGIVISIGGDFTCIFNNHYLFMGDWGIVYNVFPGINAYVEKRFSQPSGGTYIPNLIRLDYPIRKLYGEPMLPIYDYNTDSQIENSFGINFDTEANIYNFRYFKALYHGS